MQTLYDAHRFHGPRDTAMKFGDTILYNYVEKQWRWLRTVDTAYVVMCELLDTNQFNIKQIPIQNCKNYSLIHPKTGLYNFTVNRQAYGLKRLPLRGTKQTCTPGTNLVAYSPFWNKIPNSLKQELQPIIKVCPNNETIKFFLKLLNSNPSYYLFETALEQVAAYDMFSCAISTNFAISMSFEEDAYNVMYLDNEVGILNTEKKEIQLKTNYVGQELSDLLRDTKQKWRLLPVNQ